MARIDRRSKTEQFQILEAESDRLNERADCSVKAVAIVTGISYKEAHAAMKAVGRKDRQGTRNWQTHDALKALGFKTIEVDTDDFIAKYPSPHWDLKNVTTHHMDRFPKAWRDGKTYLFRCRDHIGAVVNGINHDHTKGRARRIFQIFEVVPQNHRPRFKA